LAELDPKIFMDQPGRKIEINSAKNQGVKYIVNIEWEEIGRNHRLANILSKQRGDIARKAEIVK